MANERLRLNFANITGVGDKLYGCTMDGEVYRYVPAGEGKNEYAFWTKLTSSGSRVRENDS